MLILCIITHQGTVIGQYAVSIFGSRGKEHNSDGVVGKAECAVVEVEDRIFGVPAVLVCDVEALLSQFKVLLRFRPLHGFDQAVVAAAAVIQLTQASDHLSGREKVVLVILVIHILRILAHDGRNQNPVAVIVGRRGVGLDGCPGIVPHDPGIVVIGIDDRAFQEFRIPVAGNQLVHRDLAFGNPVQKQHVQRHLVHAAADPVFVPVVEMLFTGGKVVIARRYGGRICVMLLQHQQQACFPFIRFRRLRRFFGNYPFLFAGRGAILRRFRGRRVSRCGGILRKGGGHQRCQQKKAEQQRNQLFCSHP